MVKFLDCLVKQFSEGRNKAMIDYQYEERSAIMCINYILSVCIGS